MSDAKHVRNVGKVRTAINGYRRGATLPALINAKSRLRVRDASEANTARWLWGRVKKLCAVPMLSGDTQPGAVGV